MSTKQLADLDFNSVAKILNLPNATASGQPVTYDQLNTAIEGIAWKDNCRVATQSNLNLASPGSTIDGITMATNDRVLVRSQSTGSQNGIYVWNGAAVAMTRSLDASTSDELESAVSTVDEGTSAGTTYRQTTVNFTIDSGTVTWTTFGTSAPSSSETQQGIIEIATQSETDTGTDDARAITPLKLATWSNRKRKQSGTIGDNSATSIAVTHNWGTRDVVAVVYRTASPYDDINCDVEHTDTNTITFKFAAAPTSAQFTYVLIA